MPTCRLKNIYKSKADVFIRSLKMYQYITGWSPKIEKNLITNILHQMTLTHTNCAHKYIYIYH